MSSMKILLCTNAFENITNGPAKFANLILTINKVYPEYEVHILTEDVSDSTHSLVHPLKLFIPLFLKPFGQIIRMFQYHNKAMRIRKEEFPFDILLYNNAFLGFWSAIRFSKAIGMINDDNNVHARFKDIFKSKRYFKQFVFKQFERLSVRFYKLIITNSKYLTSELVENYPEIRGKERIMYKSVEIPIVKVENRVFEEPVTILFIKNDYVRGGLFDLFAALSKAEFAYSLKVIGPSSQFNDDIMFNAKKTNVIVQILGPLPQERVFDELGKSDIFCVPSHKEALGVANMEAIIRGVSVVSTNTGGIPEVLNGGKNGWLVPVSDPLALRNALHECVHNKVLREEKKIAAQLFVQLFSKENMFKRFIEITTEVNRV